MTGKPVMLSAQARQELRQITAWYRKEGGTSLAQRWAAAVEGALTRISAHPKAGATRYAMPLRLDELRFVPMAGFPYLLFYIEHERHIDLGRVLHAQRDIPAWMGKETR